MTKYQLITGVYDSTIQSVTENPAKWTAFLRSACRNYKLRFDEQILTYAQRPDAAAVLEIERWNKPFGRWVNRGAKGIAVFDDEHGGSTRLKHYFDISDTHESSNSRPVPIWQMKPEYESEVIESLENSFGALDDNSTLVEAIVSAARNAVEDNMPDYLADLMICREGSALEQFDDELIQNEYRFVLHRSVAYMMLTRCGIDADKYLSDFRPIANFNTRNTVNAIGLATSDIAEMCLREIASTVLSLQKQERDGNRTFDAATISAHTEHKPQNDERGAGNGSVDVSDGGRLSSPEPDRAGGSGGRRQTGLWQIRVNAKEIPGAAPAGTVRESADSGQAELALDGDTADSAGAHGADDRADGDSAGRDRTAQSDRPDEMGGDDEQHPAPSGGDNTPRPNLRIKPLPTEDEQIGLVEAGGTAKGSSPAPVPSAFVMPGTFPQEAIDEALCEGSGFQDGKYRIFEQFSKSLSTKENAVFLKKEYGIGGRHPAYGIGVAQDHDGKGMTITLGGADKQKIQTSLSWVQVAERIKLLITAERYLNPKEVENYPRWLTNEENERLLRVEETAVREVLSREPTAADTTQYVYQYHLGDTVYIGSHEYVVLAFDDATVRLYDTQFPIMNKEFPREEFDQKIRENPMNNHLRVAVDNQPEQAAPTEAPMLEPQQEAEPYTPIPGERYEIQGRMFVVDSVSAQSGDVKLRDVTFENGAGFPIFRKESLDFIRMHDPIKQEQQPPQSVAPNQREDDGGEIKLKSIVIDLSPREYDEPVPDLFEQVQTHVDKSRKNREPGSGVHYPGEIIVKKVATPLEVIEAEISRKVDLMREHPDYEKIKEAAQYWIEWRGMFHRVGVGADSLVKQVCEMTDPEAVRWFSGIPWDNWREALDIGDFETLSTKIRREDKHAEAPEPTITPAWEQKKKATRADYFDAFPNIPVSERHNFRITDDNLGHGGAKTKFRANMDAINLLHELEFDGRLATPEEQEVLSRYVGWGSLPDAFKENHPGWESEYAQLVATLSPEEYNAARASTLNAHYTSPTVIKAIYKAIENMGFTTGNILDPGCGVGNFQGLLPESMGGSKVFGIEIDPITGRIAQQLYQKNSIAIQGYEDTALPDSFFDLAIGNVPFSSVGVIDKRYDRHKFSLHDYFFAKTLDKVRPGGVVAFITSKYTMDKQNPAVRRYLAQRAELLGAIRLPNNAFLANAGTQVTTDIIFLQKRDRMVDIDADWIHLGQTQNGHAVNSYFAENPDMILGTMASEDGTRMYGNMNDTTCLPFPDRDLADLLDEAVQNIHAQITDYERDDDELEEDNSIAADPTVRNFSFTVVDGQIYYRENSRMHPKEVSATAQSRIKGLIEIRECARRLIAYQTEEYPGGDIKGEQATLNRLYDSYTRKYGIINDRANNVAFSDDESYPLLCSLEVLDEHQKFKAKADMFHKRTINPYRPVTHVDTASEALAVSIGERARVDLDFMSELTGLDEDTLIKELEGVIFFNIGTSRVDKYVTADEYLSGNVREKLKTAIEAQKTFPDGRYDINVAALEAIQPADLTAPEISVRLGATWIPPGIYQQFTHEMIGTEGRARSRIKVIYAAHTAEWNITEKSSDRENILAYTTYGTKRMNAYYIIESTLNLRTVRIFDTVRDADGNEKQVLNKKETAIAQDKQDIIKARFAEWIWQDPDRREMLCNLYNERFNSIRPREYDGKHIKFHGMNPEIKLDAHQVNAVARHIYGGNALFGHVVGAGKSFEMIAAGMEAKRLGLCNKPMYVVPNNIIGDFTADFFKLYPSANVLMATAKDFEKKNRKRFCARIATGDYDGVIIAHSQFEKIPMSFERQCRSLEQQIRDIQAGVAQVKEQKGENFTIKQMERMKKALELKLKKLNDQTRKDSLVTFEELGVDTLFVDEADLFKNLYLITKMRNVGGVAQTESQKASDLFMKTRYLDEITGNRGVVLATGTFVSNSLAEVYTMQRFLQYDTLKAHGLQNFDCWASTFGETVTAMELTPEGSGFQMKTRFSSFYNLPELMAMFKEVADIQTKDMLNLPTPKVNFHTVVTKPSDMQKEMIAGLGERAERIRNREVNASQDNMLLITGDGRKIALDQRIINPMLPDHPDSKVNACVDNVFRIWDEHKEKRLTQLIFSDLSTPSKKAPIEMIEIDGVWVQSDAPQFTNVYDDIKAKLIAKGVPADEIAYIHDAKNELQKKEIVAKVRSGIIRVLLGSTTKMGAGMNAQTKIKASHDLDCPWRPRDLEQRLGRTERRGNENPEVDIYRYVTEGTFDAYCYQIIENKQRGISQVFTSKSPVRIMQEIDEVALNYAEIKALATGNPLIVERCTLEAEVNKLNTLKSSHLSQRYELEDRILKTYPAEIKRLTYVIAGYERDFARITAHPKPQGDDFVGMTINGKQYHDKKQAGSAILEACKAMTNPDAVPLGEYRGFPMELSFAFQSREYCIMLKGQLSHMVSLSADVFGNIARLDNALERIEPLLQSTREQLGAVNTQLETAKTEAQVPFPREQELAEKTARLAELTIALKLKENDREILDDVPDEGDMKAPERKREIAMAR